jgi:hypothetical protein
MTTPSTDIARVKVVLLTGGAYTYLLCYIFGFREQKKEPTDLAATGLFFVAAADRP